LTKVRELGQGRHLNPMWESLRMTTDKQIEANRRNAQTSTGPRTEDGVLACKGNAIRHGLRSLQTVVPGEDPGEWEAHLAAVVADLSPQGAVETALAEQVAAKLWRLGRVVRHEADLIANSQAEDVIRAAHEKAYAHHSALSAGQTDIPNRADVGSAKKAVSAAKKKLAEREMALDHLKALPTMQDEDALPSWSLYEMIEDDHLISEPRLDRIFKDHEEGPLRARQARAMLAALGDPDEALTSLATVWEEKRKAQEETVLQLRGKHKTALRRYKAALERRRRSHGLPGQADLDRIQRYEAHLERGMHKALDRIYALQAARGAVPPRMPSVAVAVVQGNGAGGQMGPFGSFPLDVMIGDGREPHEAGKIC
jgi:hypothetical protein